MFKSGEKGFSAIVRTEVVQEVHEVVDSLVVAVKLAQRLVEASTGVLVAEGLAISRNTSV